MSIDQHGPYFSMREYVPPFEAADATGVLQFDLQEKDRGVKNLLMELNRQIRTDEGDLGFFLIEGENNEPLLIGYRGNGRLVPEIVTCHRVYVCEDKEPGKVSYVIFESPDQEVYPNAGIDDPELIDAYVRLEAAHIDEGRLAKAKCN